MCCQFLATLSTQNRPPITTPHHFQDVSRYAQPKPRAAVAPRGGTIGLRERKLEDRFQFFRWNSMMPVKILHCRNGASSEPRHAALPEPSTRTLISPFSVNLMELPTRFHQNLAKAWWDLQRHCSPEQPRGISTVSSIPFLVRANRKGLQRFQQSDTYFKRDGFQIEFAGFNF